MQRVFPPAFGSSKSIRFEVYEYDPGTGQLRKQGLRVRLSNQPLQVLGVLLERAGELVTREELHARIWGSATFIDAEHNLNVAVNKLREALGDSAEEPRFIATVPRRGYRFIAPLNDGVIGAPEAPSLTAAARHRGRHRLALVVTVLVLLAAAAGYAAFRQFRKPSPVGRIVLAVLPFENLSGDPEQEYFSEGLTEEVITYLGRLQPSRLGVIARTSVMRFKVGGQPLDRVGRELGAQYVLEGSVRRSGARVRVTVQLIQLQDQTNIWAGTYDRELRDLLAVESDLARELTREIQFKLSPEDRARGARKHPVSAEALEEYLKGRYFWNRHTPEGDRKAIEHFQRAIDLEPAYAMAYDGLADAWICCSYDISAQRQVIDKARAAARHALELDPNLGEPHVTLGLIAWNHDLDWLGAEREFRLAIDLDPNYPTAHHWYGEFLSHMGRFEEAAAEMGRARELDPLSPIITTDTGTVYYYARDYDRTIEWCRRALDLEPNFIRARSWLTVAYYMKGMYREALEENRRVRASDESWFTIAVTGVIYAGMGKPAEAHAILRELERRARLQYVSPFSFAFVYTALAEKDQAFAWLEQAYRERAVGLNSMKTNPFFDPLRLDPRYPALLDRLRLGEEN